MLPVIETSEIRADLLISRYDSSATAIKPGNKP